VSPPRNASGYNDGFTYREWIGERAAGRSVLEHLETRYAHSTTDEWERRVCDGQVLLDEVTASPSNRLRVGQCLVWNRPPWREPFVPLGFAVLWRDLDVLAVAKPRGLPTLPAGGFLMHTLLTQVRRRHPGASPVHRLGRGTSGVVLFALSTRARQSLARAWRAGEVKRVYVGRVEGQPARSRFSIELAIGPVSHPLLGTVHAAHPGGRSARSVVRTLRAERCASVVEIQIATGRPHQIRIHLAAAGHPLVGDPLYGPSGVPRPGVRALPDDGGYLLHAARLVFPHPTTSVPTVVECAAPPELRVSS
jgi:23S rRNA pseudouridine1911/1915/1917 synthase